MTSPEEVVDKVTPVHLVEGEPFAVEVTVDNGATIWPDGAWQLYGQLRSTTQPVTLDLLPYVTPRTETPDLVVVVSLTGRQTREVVTALDGRPGRYDLWIAEPGLEQARPARIAHGPVTSERSVSAGPGA